MRSPVPGACTLLLLVACHDSHGSAPPLPEPTPELVGTWEGRWLTSVNPDAPLGTNWVKNIRFDVATDGDSVTGTASLAAHPCLPFGTIIGVQIGTYFEFEGDFGSGTTVLFTGYVEDGQLIGGDFHVLTGACEGSVGGWYARLQHR